MADNHTNVVVDPTETRISSIDVFRGLTILVMIFVSDLGLRGFSEIKGVPVWMKHAKIPDTFTFVDVVVPAFLFIVGMVIPIAIERRINKGESDLRIWAHILIRTVSLMIIGIGMGNMRAGRLGMDPIGMSPNLWIVLLCVGFILTWSRYPTAEGFKKALFTTLHVGGVALLIYLAATYRERTGEDVHWLKCRWYILGVLGWAYMISCASWFIFRRQIAGMMGCMALFIVLYIGVHEGAFDRFQLFDGFSRYVSFATRIGSASSITIAGVILGMLFINDAPAMTPQKRIAWILIFAAGMGAAAFLLRPLYGASKGGGTPSWCLYSSAICCVIYAFLFWLVDVHGVQRWSTFLMPAGTNPLLPYFLQFTVHPLLWVLNIHFLNDYFNSGIVGILRTMILALLLILLTGPLTRLGFRLRL